MDEIITTLKLGISQHLEKQGSTLEEFETSLSNLNAAEGAVKVAELMQSMLEMEKNAGIWDLLKTIPEMGVTSAIGLGSMAGAGMYGLHSYIDNQDKDVAKRKAEVDRVKTLTDRLKQDYGLSHHTEQPHA